MAAQHSIWPDASNLDTVVAGIRAGDERAFTMLLRAYAAPLGAFVTQYVRSADEAADIVQEIFFRIWARRASFEIHGTLRGYLCRAAHNAALDRLALTRRERRTAAELVLDIAARPAEPAADGEDRAAAVEQALSKLPDRCRQVFVLRWYHQLSHADIASVMGIAPKTVEAQMTRALTILRNTLAPSAKEDVPEAM